MMRTSLTLALCAVAGTVSAQILIPNGDFELADDSGTWVTASGGSAAVFDFPDTGGVGDSGFASIEEPGGGWAVLVSPIAAGPDGGGVPIGDLGLSVGSDFTVTADMINLAGTGTGGMKVEFWGSNALVSTPGDQPATGNSTSWATYTWDHTVPAGTDKLIFVPLWGAGSTVGFDNVGVVPEPSAFALLGGLFALGFIARRRR